MLLIEFLHQSNEVVNTKETNEVSSWYGYWQDGLKKHLPGRAQVK